MHSTPSDVLTQLEGFLRQDPQNDALRAEAFATALRAGLYDRAEQHLQAGLASGKSAPAWGLRRAHWLMAQHAWGPARQQLQGLCADPASPPALVATAQHDEAYIALRIGDIDQGIALLQPLVGGGTSAPDPAVQLLWMRLLHHAGRLAEALQHAKAWAAAGALAPGATGAAALIAMDEGDLARCKAWADQALAQDSAQVEALVSRACVALAESEPERASVLIDAALKQNPDDGRALSAAAFTDLRRGQLDQARARFNHALQQMPSHIGTWHGLGWTALVQNDLPAARAAFKQALELDRNFAESHGGMAVVLAREGRHQEAEEAIERALRLDRQAMSAHYARAVLDGTAADAQAVIRLAERLLAGRGGGMK